MENAYEDEKWLRRGHVRKPNKLVLGLYSMFDWIQDFGPMFTSMFKGMGKAGTTTWGLFSHSTMLFINFALMIGIIYLSVGHSYSLLLTLGFSGVSAWIAVAVWETAFVYCSLVIDGASKKGKKQSMAAWIGFLMCFGFVEVSNFMGMSESYLAKSIGIAIPLLLLVMKKVLQYQFKNEPAEKQKNNSWFTSVKSKITTQLTEENLVLESNLIEGNPADIEVENEVIEAQGKLDLDPPKLEQKTLDIEQEKLNQNPILDAPKTDDLQAEEPETNLIENLGLETEDKQPEINKQAKTSSGRKTRKSKGSTSKKKPKQVTADDVDYQAIIEVAKRLIEEHPEKKKPTKYKLNKEAKTTEPNVTEHHAQKALDMMEQKPEVNPIENLKQNLDIESDQKLDIERPKLKLAK